MNVSRVWFLCIWLCFALGGCGANNALVREETNAFARSAGSAAQAGVTFYDDVVNADRALRTTLLVLDRDCPPPEFTGGNPTLCKIGEAIVPIHGGVNPEAFEREYAQLRFLATYLGALAKLAGDIDSHAGANFQSAKDDLEALLALLGNDAKLLGDERTKATSSLLDFLNKLAKESMSAKQIRALLKEDGAQAESALRSLATGLLHDNDLLKQALQNNMELQGFVVEHGLIDDPGVRGAMLTNFYVASDVQRLAEARSTRCQKSDRPEPEKIYCGAPAAGLMAAAAVAHKELIALSTGTLNERQRARLVKLSYERFVSAVKLFVKLSAAF